MIELFEAIQGFVLGNLDQFLGLFFTVLGAIVFYFFRLRPKLVFGRAHTSLHNLNLANTQAEPPEEDNFLEVYNEQFFVLNEGRRPAHDVSVVLSHWPRNIAINPRQKVAYTPIENGGCLVEIPYIAAKELVTLDCIYLNQRAAFVESVRCDEAVGKAVGFFTVRRYSQPVYWLLWLLMLLGAASVVQFVLVGLG